MNESRDLNALRDAASRTLVALLWLHVLIASGIGLALGADWMVPAMFTAALAIVATWSWRLTGNGLSTRLVFAVAAMGGVSMFTHQMAGHPWQIDLHMYFFAALAFLVAYCDYRPARSRWRCITSRSTSSCLRRSSRAEPISAASCCMP